MIIWQGLGFVGIIFPIVGYVVVAKVVGAIEGNNYLALHSWPGALGTLIGACLVWLLALWLDKPGREVLDRKTGQLMVLKKKHTLFFVPLKYVAIIMATLALFIFFVESESTI